MNRRIPFLCLLAALTAAGCSVSLPRNWNVLSEAKYRAVIVYTKVNVYRFTNYRFRDTLLTGMSDMFLRGSEALSHGPIDSRMPSISRTLAMKDVLRIDAEDEYNEPAIDMGLYIILPATMFLAILGPVIINGTP